MASKSLTRGYFNRFPETKSSTSEELVKYLDLMPKSLYHTIVLGGDFNIPGINWDNGCELLLSSPDTHALAQIHNEPTREDNILDLLITNKPSLIKTYHIVPGISDHCAVMTELILTHPTAIQNPPSASV